MRKLFAFLFLLLLTVSAKADVLITEIGPSNHCTFFDENGDTPDWVELYNNGDEEVILDGWRLSDSAEAKNSTSLDGITIAPGAYYLVSVDGSDGWKLSASGETVCLLRGKKVLQQVSCPALEQDVSFALLENGYVPTWLPTPGSGNILLEKDALFAPEKGPRFCEFLTSAAPFRSSEGFDFLELVNTGKLISMKGWQVRLGTAGSKSFTLPDKSLGKNDLYGIYCTDEAARLIHTGFNLPAQGALVSLWRPDGTLADFIRLPLQYSNIAYGLSRDLSQWGYLTEATFGHRNPTAVYTGRAPSPSLSLPGGVYPDDSVTVEITAPDGAEIRYTTNGDMPSSKSKLYTGPITFTKTTALRACAFMPGMLGSQDVSATYVLKLDAGFPVICLIIDDQYLHDKKIGLISGKTEGVNNYNYDWEYPANFEYFDENGHSLLNQACGFSIQGDSSRGQKQKGFKLIARKAYGAGGTFDFNPFGDRSFTSYKSFNLRAAGSEGPINVRFRDACLSTLANGTHLLYSAAQPALVYMNGEVYGHYNLRERINKFFIAQHEGITDKDVIDRIDLLSETGGWVRNGSSADYFALSRYMKQNDLNDPEKLEYVLSQMDVDSFFEYIAFMMITGNKDMSNARFYRVPGGKWKWVLYDMDRSMEDVDNAAAFWVYTLDINHELQLLTDHVPFAALMKVPAMREKFLSTLGNILLTRFLPEDLIALIDCWHDKTADIMPYQLQRWTKKETMHYWESLVDKMRSCAKKRPELVVEYAKKYFRMTDEEVQLYFGGFLEAVKDS
nr:hypothetical protein [uncultured bacterium]